MNNYKNTAIARALLPLLLALPLAAVAETAEPADSPWRGRPNGAHPPPPPFTSSMSASVFRRRTPRLPLSIM